MGNKIRERRLEKGMSQDKLADLSGVDRVSISLIETGKTVNPSIKTLGKIALALGTTVDDIFFADSAN